MICSENKAGGARAGPFSTRQPTEPLGKVTSGSATSSGWYWGRDGAHLQHQGRKQHHSNSAGEPVGGRSLAPMFRDSVAGATAQLGSLRPQGQDPHEDQTRSGPRKEDESCSCCLSP